MRNNQNLLCILTFHIRKVCFLKIFMECCFDSEQTEPEEIDSELTEDEPGGLPSVEANKIPSTEPVEQRSSGIKARPPHRIRIPKKTFSRNIPRQKNKKARIMASIPRKTSTSCRQRARQRNLVLQKGRRRTRKGYVSIRDKLRMKQEQMSRTMNVDSE